MSDASPKGSPAKALQRALVSVGVAFAVLCGMAYSQSPETFSVAEVARTHSVLLGSILLALFGLDLLRQARAER
jgi:hypothetical protein